MERKAKYRATLNGNCPFCDIADVGDSVAIPISHNDETLVVFEINR